MDSERWSRIHGPSKLKLDRVQSKGIKSTLLLAFYLLCHSVKCITVLIKVTGNKKQQTKSYSEHIIPNSTRTSSFGKTVLLWRYIYFRPIPGIQQLFFNRSSSK